MIHASGKSKMPSLICIILYWMGALLVLPLPLSSQKVGQPPNVILILADDMGLGDLSIHNGGISRTPHLDQMLKESVWFSRAYSGSPVCTPSRAALLTGRYPHRTGAVTLNMRRYPELSRLHRDEVTLGTIFQENGYATGLVGKWHLGDGQEYHPMQRGFQEFAGFKGFDVPNDYFNYQLDIQGEYQPFQGEYLTDQLTERAIDFINRHQKEPFFLHLAHYAPHRPLSAPEELIASYQSEGLDTNTATIYAMIEIMDKGIGAILNTLDRLGLRDQTLVIFTSDNGPDPLTGERFNLNMRGTKYTIYEGGIHVPLMMYWPSTYQPDTLEEVIHFVDVLPTLADICGLALKNGRKVDGSSLEDLLSGKPGILPKYRFWQWNRGNPYYSHNAALIEGDWKLVRPYVTRQIPTGKSDIRSVLYNINKDPLEQYDLSKEHPLQYQIMQVELERLIREIEFDRMNSN